MTRHEFISTVLVIVVFLGTICLTIVEWRACDAAGGALVRGTWWWECVEARR